MVMNQQEKLIKQADDLQKRIEALQRIPITLPEDSWLMVKIRDLKAKRQAVMKQLETTQD
jgi:hypothetical protein